MKYKDSIGNVIHDLDEWRKFVFDNKGKQKHWKEGRSAHAIADFMMNKNGEKYIKEIVSKLLGEEVIFEEAIPELEIRFDKYGHGREHDLGIFGKTESGKSVFIGIESKVDESFNEKVSEVYLKAKAKQLSGVNTNAPQRIEDLIKLNFPKITSSIFDLRYQLLYATAGTACVDAEIKILMFIVFKTELYDKGKGNQNSEDYKKFIKAVDANPIKLCNQIDAHKLKIGDKEIYSLYMEKEMKTWNNVMFEPWEGNKYPTGGILKKKILVLGDSHYCDEECVTDCEEKFEREKCSGFTREVVEDYLNPEKKASCKEQNFNWKQTFSRFVNTFFEEEASQEEREEFFNSVIFYNFLQRAAGAGWNSANQYSDCYSKEQHKDAFYEVLDAYMPDVVISWGNRLWETLPNNWGYGEANRDKYKLNIRGEEVNYIYVYPYREKEIILVGVYHPCSSRYNSDFHRELYRKLDLV